MSTMPRKGDTAASTLPLQSARRPAGRLFSRSLIVVVTTVVLFFTCAGWPQQGGFQVALGAGALGFLFLMSILWRV
jgi:hypothetical protein